MRGCFIADTLDVRCHRHLQRRRAQRVPASCFVIGSSTFPSAHIALAAQWSKDDRQLTRPPPFRSYSTFLTIHCFVFPTKHFEKPVAAIYTDGSRRMAGWKYALEHLPNTYELGKTRLLRGRKNVRRLKFKRRTKTVSKRVLNFTARRTKTRAEARE